MKIPQASKVVSGQVVVDSTNIATVLVTDILLAAGASDLALVLEQRALGGTGSFKGKGRYRFFDVRTDQPDAWTDSANERTTAGQFTDTWDISATTNKMWVQGAFGAYEAGGVAEAFSKCQSQVQGKGVLAAVDTISIQPVTNSGSSCYAAVGKRFPELGITKVMIGIVFSGVMGTITYRGAYREFQGDADLPLSWVDLGSGDSTRTTDGAVNMGQLTVTPTAGYMLGQVGLKFSGTGLGTAQVTVAAIY
jgi:hypothetical protein